MTIEAHELFFRHAGANTDALQNLSFTVREGDFCCLAGVNGSGKSTLLGVLAGLFASTAGTLRVAGLELPRQAYMVRKHVALVPQDPDLYILGSLVQEDLFLALPEGDEAARARTLGIAHKLGLGGLLENPVNTLSYGQKRKLCLASALAAGPRILLLDEPFAGLDYPSSMAMRVILADNKAAGITQIIVSHDLELIAQYIDLFLLLQEGRLMYCGPQEGVLPHLIRAEVRPPCWWLLQSAQPVWDVLPR